MKKCYFSVFLFTLIVLQKKKSNNTGRKQPKQSAEKWLVSRKSLIKPEELAKPAVNTVISQVESFIKNELYIPDSAKILLAVSGGVDSIAMLDIIANLSVKYGYKPYVVHYNHQLRGVSSDGDEEYARKLAAYYSIPFHCTRGNVKEYAENNHLSLEQAARIMRYRFIEQTARTLKVNYIATAHTLDDSAETFLFNLMRGSGLTGLSGIPWSRALNKNIMLVRPLIGCRKQQLVEYAIARNSKWREDETNAMLNFTRNKIRHELIKYLETEYNPSIVDILSRTSLLLKGADKFINDFVQQNLKNIVTDKRDSRFSLRIGMLQTYSEFIRGEIIQASLKANFHLQPLPMAIIDRIASLCSLPSGSIADISKNFYVLRDRNRLVFSKSKPLENQAIMIEKTGEYEFNTYKLILKEVRKNQVKFKNEKSIEYLDYDKVPMLLYLRNWQRGDAFRPLGMEGSLKLSDFFINEKISIVDKGLIPILASKSDIIWICGQRISDNYKIDDTTKRYLKIEIIELNNNKKENL